MTGIPAVPDSLCKKVARYLSWSGSAFQDWTPDGKSMVAIIRSGQTDQIHLVKNPGVAPKQISFFSEPVTSVSVDPDPARRLMVFTKDSGGNENFQIFLSAIDSCTPRLLTSGGTSQNGGIVWSNMGDRFAFESNARNGVDFDIYLSDLTIVQPVLTAGGSWSVLDWSPDDKMLLVQRYHSRTASFIAVLDLASGTWTPLGDTTDTVSQETAVFAAGGKGVFLTSDESSSFRTLRYYDFATRREAPLTQDIKWDVRGISISNDRGTLAFITNENGFSRVFLMNAATHVYREIPGLPQGGIYHLRFDPTAAYLGVVMNLPLHPEDCCAIRLRDFTLVRWTNSPLGGLEEKALVAPDLIHYPTFDSIGGNPRQVPCFLYKPQNRKAPFGVMILVHGGPESQFWPYFSPTVQYFVNEAGLAVLAPNVRGSGGYGKEYLKLDDGYKRENAVLDIGALLDWIARRLDLDASRVCISGGSYGGYLSLASLEKYGNRISCGIDMYGISNFVTFLEHTSGYRRDLRRVEYGDERDPAMRGFLKRISPLSQASHLARPLLIIQGANDPRVPLGESEQIAEAARKNNSSVWMLIANDEGHGYRKKSNIDFQECVEAFFLQTCLPPGK